MHQDIGRLGGVKQKKLLSVIVLFAHTLQMGLQTLLSFVHFHFLAKKKRQETKYDLQILGKYNNCEFLRP